MSKLIREVMEDSSREFADIDAVRWLEKKEIVTRKYSELGENVVNIRRALSSLGFEGTHIALIGGSSVWWIEAYLGIVSGRMSAIPLDAGLPVPELIDLINRSDSEGLFLDKKYEKNIADYFEGCPKLKKIWILQGKGEVDDERVGSLSDLTDAGKDLPEGGMPDPDDLAMIIFTSGTTGKSKGVMLTQNNMAANLEAMSFATAPGVVLLNVLPVHHAFCLVMDWLRGFARGAVVCVNDSFMHMVKNMSVFRPHAMLMVPLMIETIFKRIDAASTPETEKEVAAKIFGGRLRYIFTGGAHLDEYYLERFSRYDIKVLEGYGMSECSPVISANTPKDYKYGSVGKPLPNVEVSFSEQGEILVRGTSVMKEYYNMEKETSEAIQEGWLHTGDKGYMDEDGFLFINGRIKNLIILSNGENVSPEELENKLGIYPLIGEVVVVGGAKGLIAVVYPDQEEMEKQSIEGDSVKDEIQKYLDDFNRSQPSYRHIVGLVMRDEPFERSSTRKIKRELVKVD